MNYEININDNTKYIKLDNIEYPLPNDNDIIIILLDDLFNIKDIKSYNVKSPKVKDSHIIIGTKMSKPFVYDKQIYLNEYFVIVSYNNKYKIYKNNINIKELITLEYLNYNYSLKTTIINDIDLYIINKIFNECDTDAPNKLIIMDLVEVLDKYNLNTELNRIIKTNKIYKTYLSKNRLCYFINNNIEDKTTEDELIILVPIKIKNKYLPKINLVIDDISPELKLNLAKQDYTNINIYELENIPPLPYMKLKGTELFYNGFFINLIMSNKGTQRIWHYSVDKKEQYNILTKIKYNKYPFINVTKTENYSIFYMSYNDGEIIDSNELIYVTK
jgi:hypothetical protein